MNVTREYVSASVNRYPNNIDWGRRLIAFGSSHSVGLYDVDTFRVVDVLIGEKDKPGHCGEVRSVRWIIPDEVLVSSSTSKDAIIWKTDEDGKFRIRYHLKDHSSPLLVANSLTFNNDNAHFVTVTTTTDFVVTVFFDDVLKSQITLKHFIFDISLVFLPSISSKILAFLACEDTNVHVAFIDPTTGKIEQIIPFSFGHQDWVRSVDVLVKETGEVFVASAAQDSFVRVLKIKTTSSSTKSDVNRQIISNGEEYFEVSLETVLAGHEASVDCVKWVDEKNILTASLDKTIIIWTDSGNEDIWMESLRVGEIGGNNLGFLGVSFPKESNDLVTFSGHSYNGAVHIWKKSKDGLWTSSLGFGGHFDAVTDISWDVEGNYLLSVSNDQTTRLHSLVKRENDHSSWYEISRPQIHGYVMNCISTIDHLTFASGADEKVLRIFKATKNFVQQEKLLTGVTLVSDKDTETLAVSSTVPALGLTNRAVFGDQTNNDSGDDISSNKEIIPHCLTNLCEPPTEETLMTSTLWPEVQKLYGHGNEVFAVASDHRKSLVASACKASKPEQAEVILWDVERNFKLHQRLAGHSLTVTSIKFSPDDKFLVSVSRDRTWFLYQRDESTNQYTKVANTDKNTCIHGRIIWDVSWLPDGKSFTTVSRDKKVIIWAISEADGIVSVKAEENHILTLEHPVMTCDIFRNAVGDGKILSSFGLEDGSVLFYCWSEKDSWKCLETKGPTRHHLSVRKVRFCPVKGNDEILVASCSDDRTVQIVKLH